MSAAAAHFPARKESAMEVDLSEAKRIIRQYGGAKGVLIPLLQDIQNAYGYVPRECVDLIAKELSVYPVEIYGILTFYTQFYLTPRGRHTVKVCQGTACHVMGGKDVLDYLQDKLHVCEGQTTADGQFSLERAACLGCCGMAPVVMVDEEFHGRCKIQDMDGLLKNYQSQGGR